MGLEVEPMPGFLILVGFQLLGLGLHRLGVPLPGGVLGLLLFAFALTTRLIKLEWVDRTASFLVRHMTLLFIPMMGGLSVMSDKLRHDGVALLVSTVASLLAVLLTTGGLAHFLLRDAESGQGTDSPPPDRDELAKPWAAGPFRDRCARSSEEKIPEAENR
jgi:holin-like protein